MGRYGREWLVLSALWVVLSLALEALVAFLIGAYPPVAAAEGADSDEAIFLLMRLAAPVFALVLLLLIYLPLRFRAGPDDTGDSPVQVRTNRAVIGAWVGLSVVLNLIFAVNPGIDDLQEIWASATAPDPLVVDVTALQWTWQFDYPQYGITGQTNLVLPVDRTTKFVIRSNDVVHSFWVPSFRLKSDAVPGQTRVLYLTPNRLISTEVDPMARVQCAELCGVGHAWMRATVDVVSAEDFQAWVDTQQQASQGM